MAAWWPMLGGWRFWQPSWQRFPWMWIWKIRDAGEEIRREAAFGSKRWHWPAAALLALLFIGLMLLRFGTSG